MDTQQVFEFLLGEIKRLNEEEHVMDLAKAGCYEELSQIECKYPEYVTNAILMKHLCLRVEDLPEGSTFALALWIHNNPKGLDEYDLFKVTNKDYWKTFANKLVEETGDLGKSIAYQMSKKTLDLVPNDDFFTDRYASKYRLYETDVFE